MLETGSRSKEKSLAGAWKQDSVPANSMIQNSVPEENWSENQKPRAHRQKIHTADWPRFQWDGKVNRGEGAGFLARHWIRQWLYRSFLLGGKRPSMYCKSGFFWFRNQARRYKPVAGSPEYPETQFLPVSDIVSSLSLTQRHLPRESVRQPYREPSQSHGEHLGGKNT